MHQEPVHYHGTNHFDALFIEQEQAKAPNIRDDGTHMVKSQFIIFGNGLLQLLQFEPRPWRGGMPWSLREPLTSPCIIGAAHIDFWIDDSVDMNDFIADVEDKVASRGQALRNVQWNRPVPQENRNDRMRCPRSRYANKVPDDGSGGAFGGLEWSYFKGPVAEQLELYRITGSMKRHIGNAYCQRRAVSRAFTPQANSQLSNMSPADVSRKIYGMFQYGFRTDDLHASVGFYTEVLGGSLIDYPVHGIDIRGDDAHWMILANETLTAYEYAEAEGIDRKEAMNRLGVSNISTSGHHRLDHRFILFDNFVVEPLLYTSGLTFGGTVFSPSWSHTTSPAYVGIITAAFGTDDGNTSLQSFVDNLKSRAQRHGFSRSVFPTNFASFPPGHSYSGLSYGYGKGPSGESLNYVKISGEFRKRVEEVMVKVKAVSTAFSSTNIFAEMKPYCDSVVEPPTF